MEFSGEDDEKIGPAVVDANYYTRRSRGSVWSTWELVFRMLGVIYIYLVEGFLKDCMLTLTQFSFHSFFYF